MCITLTFKQNNGAALKEEVKSKTLVTFIECE